MFLSDELEEIVAKNLTLEETAKEFKVAFVSRMVDPDVKGFTAYVNSLRSIDYAWKDFCKKHPEYKPTDFRESVLNCISEENKKNVIRLLKWDIN